MAVDSAQATPPESAGLTTAGEGLATRRTDLAHDLALQTVLDRLTGGVPERADTPDGWITAVRRLEAREAKYAPFPAAVDQRLRDVLGARGIEQVYTHQAAAIEHALARRHVVITTPTASGKTLCYNAPVLSTVLRDPSARALYLFPTKALAQDQLAELHTLSDQLSRRSDREIGVFTYDGDTPQDARRAIRGRAHVVLSNPDMVHSGILPHHPRWAKLFENLQYVVIDELHAYRGVFGSHLANVLRRLRRVCLHYGSTPTFICSSATIANPRELAEALVEEPFELVSESGAPRGEKAFLFVNPPVVNRQLGIRRSYLAETRRVAAEFLKRSLQLIVFAQSRLSTEILTTYLKDDFDGPPGTREQIRGYRGGYLPQRRREIEKGLREGTVRAVVSTNALELGIDIGALDVCVMAGYPGSIAATWQRAGRAGRRSGRSAAVLVGSSAPLDQFVVRNPSYFFDASPERALINPDNLHILVDHVKCAAFELPFSTAEQFGRPGARAAGRLAAGVDAPAQSLEPRVGIDVQAVLAIVEEGGFVHRAGDVWQWTNESYPADAVSLRSISSDNFVIVDTTNVNGERCADVIGETSFTSGPSTLHVQAIYLIEGALFQVEKLDFDGRKAYVRRIDCDYYTDAITYTKVTVLDTFADGALVDAPPEGAVVVGGPPEGGPYIDPDHGPEGGPYTGSDHASPEGGPDTGPDHGPPEGGPYIDSHVGAGFSRPVPATHASLDVGAGFSRPAPAHGEVHVSSRVVGFKKIKFYTNENVGSGELDLPEQEMHTTAYWLTLPAALMAALPFAADDRRDGVVGLSFAMRQVAQLLLMCDRQDIGISIGAGDHGLGRAASVHSPIPELPEEPRIFVFDNYPGGIGFSEPLFRMHAELLSRTRELIVGCECQHGCPTCVGPVGDTGPLAKTVAVRILDLLV